MDEISQNLVYLKQEVEESKQKEGKWRQSVDSMQDEVQRLETLLSEKESQIFELK